MLQALDPLFHEIIKSAHGPEPVRAGLYRPFDVGPSRLARREASVTIRPAAVIAGAIATLSARLGSFDPLQRRATAPAVPCCQTACC